MVSASNRGGPRLTTLKAAKEGLAGSLPRLLERGSRNGMTYSHR